MKKSKVILICIVLFFIIGSILALLLLFNLGDINHKKFQKNLSYQSTMIEKLNTELEFEINEVFDFDFDRGYIIKEVYADGDSIARDLGLNTNNKPIREVANSNSKRIVFVNAQGNYIHDFVYNEFYLYTDMLGTIIYPNTIVKKAKSKYDDILCFEIDGRFEYYDTL